MSSDIFEWVSGFGLWSLGAFLFFRNPRAYTDNIFLPGVAALIYIAGFVALIKFHPF